VTHAIPPRPERVAPAVEQGVERVVGEVGRAQEDCDGVVAPLHGRAGHRGGGAREVVRLAGVVPHGQPGERGRLRRGDRCAAVGPGHDAVMPGDGRVGGPIDCGSVAAPAGGRARGDLRRQRGRQPGADHQLAQHVAGARAVEARQGRQDRLRHRDRRLARIVLVRVQDLLRRRRWIAPDGVDGRPRSLRAQPGEEQEPVHVHEPGQLRQPGWAAGARGGAQPVRELGQRGRTKEPTAGVDHGHRGEGGVALDDRQARAGGVAVERQRGRRQELAHIEALIGQRVRDLVDERDPLALERQEVRDQKALGGRVVDRARRRRGAGGPQARVVGAAVDEAEALEDLLLGGHVRGGHAGGERGGDVGVDRVAADRAGRQRAVEGEVAGARDLGHQPVDLAADRRVGQGGHREHGCAHNRERRRASHGAQFEVNTPLLQ